MFDPKSNIGIDIGTSSIKLVELSAPVKNDKRFKLVNFFSYPINKKKEEVLANVVTEYKIRNRFVNIAISGESVIVRLINMPKMSREELNKSLRFEAEKYIPFDIEEVELQAQILREKIKDNKMQVLLAAAKKKNIEALINLVINAGLRPKIIDVESFALYNAFEFNHPGLKETCLLLNVGAGITNINILEEGALSLSRDVFMGGKIFTQELMRTFGLGEPEAESLKKDPQDKKNEVLEALKPTLFNLKNEVGSSIDYFESQSERKVDKIYLSGGSSYLLGLADLLRESFEVKVELWDPLVSFERDIQLKKEQLNKSKGEFVIAVGLALRN
jgi:type IV pilus assembly protein PilM